MQYRHVGNTGIEISEIGFGCGGFAGLFVRGSHAEQRAAVTRALELGINYFDEAPEYGNGVSETNLGLVLKDIGERPYITTKIEVYAEHLDDIAGRIVQSTEESLQRLQVDYVDFLQVHNPPRLTETTELRERSFSGLSVNDYLKPGGALDGLERLQRDGKARFIGFTNQGGTFEPAAKLIDTGRFNLVNLACSLMEPQFGVDRPYGMTLEGGWGPTPLISYAHAHGVGISVINGLASGALTDQGVGGEIPHPLTRGNRLRNEAAAFRFLSRPGERKLAEASIRWLLGLGGVSTVLGGFSSTEQVEESTGNSGAPALSPQDLKRIEMVWRGNFASARPE